MKRCEKLYRVCSVTAICLLAAVLLGVTSYEAAAQLVLNSYLNPFWTDDAEKSHDAGNWLKNYWDDLDGDGAWDKGVEPFGDEIDPEWSNPVEGKDGSCWMVAAANMLAAAGYRDGDANEIYWDIVYNMPTNEKPGMWMHGGWISDGLQWYLDNRPEPGLQSTVTAYYSELPQENLGLPWVEKPFEVAANALADGAQVGMDIYHEGALWHSVVFQGYETATQTLQITDSNRDKSSDGLDTYDYFIGGATGWYINYDDVGDSVVNMLIILNTESSPELDSYLNPFWTDDAEKSHDAGNWLKNYWDDLDGDGAWDKGVEPFGDEIDPEWSNPVEGKDGSCWMVAAANMLAAAGYRDGDANEIYWDIVYNMPTNEKPGMWMHGGWISDALQWYLDNRPELGLQSSVTAYYSELPQENLGLPWVEKPFEVAANALSNGAQVGMDIYHEGALWHSVVFQGYETATQTLQITDSNRDKSPDGLDTYDYFIGGATGWYINYDEVGDSVVNMLIILQTESDMGTDPGTGPGTDPGSSGTPTPGDLPTAVPEPSTIMLLGFGILGLLTAAVRKKGNR